MKTITLSKRNAVKCLVIASMIFNGYVYAQPANDCVFNAIDITAQINAIGPTNRFECNQYTYSSALNAPTRDNVNGNSEQCDAQPDYRDVWFTFTITAATPPVWIDTYGDGIDYVAALYSGIPAGTCGPAGNITGLTYIDCSDGITLGDSLDVAECTTPLHSRIDCSWLTPGTYYYRIWEWNGAYKSLGELVQEDVYVWQIVASSFHRPVKQVYEGHVTLLR